MQKLSDVPRKEAPEVGDYLQTALKVLDNGKLQLILIKSKRPGGYADYTIHCKKLLDWSDFEK